MNTQHRVAPRSKAGRLAEKPGNGGLTEQTGDDLKNAYESVQDTPARGAAQHNAHVLADYTVVVDNHRRYTEVSNSFCKLLGYQREELIGRKYDDVTAPRTNDIPIVFDLFMKSGYMHGIWILVHRGGTRILVRYEAWIRPDGLTECQMELLGAGA
jgi:PAS domain S-box-containing protein